MSLYVKTSGVCWILRIIIWILVQLESLFSTTEALLMPDPCRMSCVLSFVSQHPQLHPGKSESIEQFYAYGVTNCSWTFKPAPKTYTTWQTAFKRLWQSSFCQLVYLCASILWSQVYLKSLRSAWNLFETSEYTENILDSWKDFWILDEEKTYFNTEKRKAGV